MISDVRERLIEGNTHASHFTPTQAADFVNEYTVLAQYRNDPLLPGGTGFSGTLFKSKSGELTLSFRSTEFIDDNVRDSVSTNKLEVKELGWALGQISEMEDWYATLRADPALLRGQRFNVTGYSLGGHLATAFNILRREEAEEEQGASPVISTYTFNGAGVGDLKAGVTLHDVLADFREYRSDPDVTSSEIWNSLTQAEQISTMQQARSRALTVATEQKRVRDLFGVTFALDAKEAPMGDQATVEYQLAALLAGRKTIASSLWFGDDVNKVPFDPLFADAIDRVPIPGMIEIVGSDGGNLGPSFVSNSGVHYGSRQEIFIEDQPLARGLYSVPVFKGDLISFPASNDFADTHSLVLLQDSLGLMAALERLDPAFSSERATQIFQAISSAGARSTFGTQGLAEGDVLERALDAVREIVFGPGTTPTVSYDETLTGNTWHEDRFRVPFQDNLKALNGKITELTFDQSFAPRIEVLADKGAEELQMLAETPGIGGDGYRYALRKLNPFALVDFPYGAHDANGELDLYDAESGTGMTDAWLEARAKFLETYTDFRITNGRLSQQAIGGFFEDRAMNVSLGRSHEFSPRVVFGSDIDGLPLTGSLKDDFLFGGTGADTLSGGDGDDYLESGPGDDTLTGGHGDDELDGGKGFDTYVYAAGDGGDSIFDFDGLGRILYQGRELTGGEKRAEGVYEDGGGVRFQLVDAAEDGRTLVIDGSLRVEDFRDGMLGLVFEGDTEPDAIPESAAAHEYFDSGLPADFDPESDPYAFLLDLFGSEEADAFFTGGALPVAGRGGNDAATFEGEDGYTASLDMGSGDDYVDLSASAGGGSDAFISGGSGGDYLAGSRGDDRIWGDSYRAFSAAAFFGAGSASAGAFVVDGLVYNLDAGPGFPLAGSLPQGYGAFRKSYDAALLAEGALEDDLLRALTLDGAFVHGGLADAVVAVLGNTAAFDDYVDAGEGDDYVAGGSGSDDIYGGAGDDILLGDYETAGAARSSGAPSYAALAEHFGGLASLFGRPGDDSIDGGEGDDEIRDVDGGNDMLLGGDGDDTIESAENLWTPEWGEGAQNTIRGGAGNDEIDLVNETGGFDLVDGGEGDDMITVTAFGPATGEGAASPGRAFVYGGAGNDGLLVDADDGYVDGGSGDDDYTVHGRSVTISDSSGNDTLHLELPDLSQVDAWLATLPGDAAGAPGRDGSALSQSWTVWRDGRDLVVSTESTFEDASEDATEVVIERWFAGADRRIESTITSDEGGTALSAAQFVGWGGLHYGSEGADEMSRYSEHADRSLGGDGDDVILTGGGADFLCGGRGDDDLVGGAGNDIYAYLAGDGNDMLEDVSGLDELRLGPGLAIADVSASLDGEGLALTVGAGRIEIAGASREDPGIERLRFFDGTTTLVAGLLPPLAQPALVARTFEAGPDDADQTGLADPGAPDATPPSTAGGVESSGVEVAEDTSSGDESGVAAAEPVIAEDFAVAAEATDAAVELLPVPLESPLRQLLALAAANETGNVVAQSPRDIDPFTAYALYAASAQQTSPDFLRVTIAPAGLASDDEVSDRPSRGGNPVAPLELQSVVDAVEAFDAGGFAVRAEVPSPGASAPQPTDRSGPSPAGPPEVNSWVLTNALLQFHLEQAGAGDAPGEDGGAPSRLLEALSVPLARQSLSLPSFGQQAPSLATFSGLQEGFTRL